MTTQVINVKSKKPYDVYIGNLVRYWPDKYPQTKWGNPFKIEKIGMKEVPGSREKVIRQYREYILDKPELLKQIPLELKGKTLGCWCKPEPCHGDILVKIADSS